MIVQIGDRYDVQVCRQNQGCQCAAFSGGKASYNAGGYLKQRCCTNNQVCINTNQVEFSFSLTFYC